MNNHVLQNIQEIRSGMTSSQKNVADLLHTGKELANCAFNLGQITRVDYQLTARDCEVLSSVGKNWDNGLKNVEITPDIKSLIHIGSQLATCAFNLGQTSKVGYKLTTRDCEVLNELQVAWDGAKTKPSLKM